MDTARSDRLLLTLLGTAVLGALFAWQALLEARGASTWAAIAIATLLFFLYLAAGWTPGTRSFFAWLEKGPGRVYVLPLALWLISLGYGKLTGRLDGQALIIGLAFLILPVEMARREGTPWRVQDLALGWAALLIPLLTPLAGKQPFAVEVALRVGAFLLPAVFVYLARGRWQGIRLLLGITYIWYSVEFGEYPRLGFPGLSLYHLYAVVMALYLLLVAGRLPRIGFGLSLRGRELLIAAREFLFFMPFGLAIGILTGFLHPHFDLPSVGEMIASAVAIFVFTGIPEELLFRGVIHTFISDYLPGPRQALLLSSLIFGAAHLDNPPMVGIYFILATIAGWFYGRAYTTTGRITPAALVHTAVDWVWGMVL